MPTSRRRGVLLFAHGAADPEWALPFAALQERVRHVLPGVPVELGYLERMSPDFPSGIRRLVAAGATEITVVPLFLARGGHLRQDLPALAAAAQTCHPEVKLHLSPALGEVPELLEAIAQWVRQQLPTPDN